MPKIEQIERKPVKKTPKFDTQYIKKVSKLSIVQKVLVVEDEDETTILTVINATPFEDSLREPIYLAQLDVLRCRDLEHNISFRILNEKELSEDQTLETVIPEHAKAIWQR